MVIKPIVGAIVNLDKAFINPVVNELDGVADNNIQPAPPVSVTPTITPTRTPTPSVTRTPSATRTPTPSVTGTPAVTPTRTATRTVTPTRTPSRTAPAASVTPTPTPTPSGSGGTPTMNLRFIAGERWYEGSGYYGINYSNGEAGDGDIVGVWPTNIQNLDLAMSSNDNSLSFSANLDSIGPNYSNYYGGTVEFVDLSNNVVYQFNISQEIYDDAIYVYHIGEYDTVVPLVVGNEYTMRIAPPTVPVALAVSDQSETDVFPLYQEVRFEYSLQGGNGLYNNFQVLDIPEGFEVSDDGSYIEITGVVSEGMETIDISFSFSSMGMNYTYSNSYDVAPPIPLTFELSNLNSTYLETQEVSISGFIDGGNPADYRIEYWFNTLPSWLTLNTDGPYFSLNGYAELGSYEFGIEVLSEDMSDQELITFTVTEATPVTYDDSLIPSTAITQGQSSNITLSATGGDGVNYEWGLYNSGFPNNLGLQQSTGQILGNAVAPVGTYVVTVRATSGGIYGQFNIPIYILPSGPLDVYRDQEITTVEAGTPFNYSVYLHGGNVSNNSYNYSVFGGSLQSVGTVQVLTNNNRLCIRGVIDTPGEYTLSAEGHTALDPDTTIPVAITLTVT